MFLGALIKHGVDSLDQALSSPPKNLRCEILVQTCTCATHKN